MKNRYPNVYKTVYRHIGYTVLASIILTPLWLLLVYLQWDLIDLSFSIATENFNKWPWFKGTCALSALTFLFPFYAYWISDGNEKKCEQQILTYAFLYLWLPLLMMHPGTEDLGVLSDGKVVLAIFLILFTHYFCAKRSVWLLCRLNSAINEIETR